MTDERHNINESHDKIRLETDITRGTGTRDQEKLKLKARGDDCPNCGGTLHALALALVCGNCGWDDR